MGNGTDGKPPTGYPAEPEGAGALPYTSGGAVGNGSGGAPQAASRTVAPATGNSRAARAVMRNTASS